MTSIAIVGCGPGNRTFATPVALGTIAQADILVGAQRLVDEFGAGKNVITYKSVQHTLETIRCNITKNVAVLVTGDPGFFSITALIVREFSMSMISIIPGICSITYAFSRLGIAWQDAVFLSAHKNLPANFNQVVKSSVKLGILTSPSQTPASISAQIDKNIADRCRFYVGERLSYHDEKLYEYSYGQVCQMQADVLSVLIIIKQDVV